MCGTHPSAYGHTVMAQLLANFWSRATMEIGVDIGTLSRGGDGEKSNNLKASLPPPLKIDGIEDKSLEMGLEPQTMMDSEVGRPVW